MKQYLLSIYQPDGDRPAPEVLEKVMRDVDALIQEAKSAGAWVFNGGLHAPSTATVVRIQDGEALMTDGPFAEGKEHIGGFLVIKAADLDSALEWGRKAARAITLPIEVRPVQDEARALRVRRSSVYSVRNRVALLPFWSASSVTSTSPRKQSRTPSPRRYNVGRPRVFLRVRPDGSSPPPAIGRSTASAGRRRARTGMPRLRCCMRATNQAKRISWRARCATTSCA